MNVPADARKLPDARTTPNAHTRPLLTVPETGALLLGLGKSASYDAALRGDGFPPVIRVGGRMRVRTVDVLRVMGFGPDGVTPIDETTNANATPIDATTTLVDATAS